MKSFLKTFEMFVAVAFGFAYWRYDLATATVVLMGAMTLFVMFALVVREPLTKLQWGTWLVVVVLGGASLIFKDEAIIKWKTTLINGCFGLVLLLSHVFGEKTILQRLLDDKLKASVEKFRKLNFAASLYLFTVAILNLLVAFQFSTTVWVNFKLFGIMFLNFLFIGGSFFYLKDEIKRYIEEQERQKPG